MRDVSPFDKNSAVTARRKSRRRRRFGSVDQPRVGGLVRIRYRVEDERHTEWALNFEDAERQLSIIEADLLRGRWKPPTKSELTFNEVADQWLATKDTPSTIARDKSVLKCWWRPRLGKKSIVSITRADLQGVIDAMTAGGLVGKTVVTHWGVGQAVMNFAEDEELITRAPVKRIKLPRVRPAKHVEPSADVLLALIAALPPQYTLLGWLLGVCGMRWSEVRRLCRADVDVDNEVILIPSTLVEVEGKFHPGHGKTDGSLGRVALPKEVAIAFREHLLITGRRDPGALLFTAPRGGPLRSSNFRNRVWNPAVLRASASGYTVRECRQVAAALMREAGASEQEVGARLRHTKKSAVTSDLYGGITVDRQRAVNEGMSALLRARRVTGGSQSDDASTA